MADLAGIEGGNAATHAQKSEKQTEGPKKGENMVFVEKGGKILETMTATLLELQKHSKTLNTVVENVEKLKSDVSALKRKSDTVLNDTVTGPSTSKQCRIADHMLDSDGDNESEVGMGEPSQDLDALLELSDEEEAHDDEEEADYFLDINDYFGEKTDVGEDLSTKMATVANASLRAKFDNDKFKELKEKYKRPGNVENLQIPTADGFIWKQLKGITKGRDVQMQKSSAMLNQCLVPVLRTMDYIRENKVLDKKVVSNLVNDTLKLMVSHVAKTDSTRKDFMFREMRADCKTICAETTPSAKNLFGEQIKENLKGLTEKDIKITPNQTFLANRGSAHQMHSNSNSQQQRTSQSKHYRPNKHHHQQQQQQQHQRQHQNPSQWSKKNNTQRGGNKFHK